MLPARGGCRLSVDRGRSQRNRTEIRRPFYRQGAFRRNRGLRIDHIWATETLARRARSCWIDREERTREKASDLVPVMVNFAEEMD